MDQPPSRARTACLSIIGVKPQILTAELYSVTNTLISLSISCNFFAALSRCSKVLRAFRITSLSVITITPVVREDRQAAAAFEILEKVLSQFPKDPDLQSEMAMLCEKLARFDQMESLLRELMQSKPTDPHAFNALGYSLADRKIRLDEARELILKAVSLAPNDPFIQDSLGWLEFRQGNAQEALRILEAAFKARPDAEIAAHLGEVLWAIGQTAKAGSIWREGLMLKADNETLLETLKQYKFQP